MQHHSDQPVRDWGAIKEKIRSGADMSEVFLKLETREQLNGWQISLLNLIFMDGQAEQSKAYFSKTLELNESMRHLTERLVSWSRSLAILTGVLAIATLLNIIMGFLHR